MAPESRIVSADRLRRLASRARTLAAFYLVLLFAATHLPTPPHDFASLSDKVYHVVGYTLLTMSVLVGWELSVGVLEAKHYFAVWLAGTLYGAFDELTQIPVGRTCDMNDWAADVLGIVVGLILFRIGRRPIYRALSGGDWAIVRR